MLRRTFRAGLVLLVAASSCMSGSARADNLDEALMTQAEKVRDFLVERNYRSVGILSFRLQHGNEKPSFRGGLLIQSLPERLESALIVSLNENQHPLKVAHLAAAEAGRKLKDANYRTEADRVRLFSVTYPQAWGNPRPQLSIDAFITGKIIVAPNLRTLTVQIECFDKARPAAIVDVLQFNVPVDRYILADIGQGFAMSTQQPGPMLRAVTDNDIVSAASEASKDSSSAEETTSTGAAASFASATSAKQEGFPLHITLFYDDVVQSLEPDPSAGGNANFKVRTPTDGEALEIEVVNLTNEKLGLVLSVNGLSTLYKEKGEPNQLKKWILEPGVPYRIKGYYNKDDEGYETIRALSEAQSLEQYDDLGGDLSAGLIHAHVFRPASQVTMSSVVVKPSIRLMSDGEATPDQTASLAELQSLIVPGKFDKGLFKGWGDNRAEKLSTSSLGKVQLTDSLIIRYYSKSQSGQPF